MEKTLTITIPSYNVENTLRETVDSLLVPSIMNDLEILIVNDGSKDSTSVIGHEYERQYPQTVRVIDKKNGGHGSTINAGIQEAAGRYFKVVDGDDWLITENMPRFIDDLKKTNADIVYNPFFEVNDQTRERKLNGLENDALTAERVYDFDSIADQLSIQMHAMTYKTSILKKHHITIDEHRFYVDAEYVLMPIPFVKTIETLDYPMYLYRLFTEQQSMNIKNMQKNVQHHYDVTMHMVDYYLQYRPLLNEAKRDYMKRRVLALIEMQYQIYFSFPFDWKVTSEINRFNKELKAKDKQIYGDSHGTMVRLIRMQPKLFYPVIKLREKVRRP